MRRAVDEAVTGVHLVRGDREADGRVGEPLVAQHVFEFLSEAVHVVFRTENLNGQALRLRKHRRAPALVEGEDLSRAVPAAQGRAIMPPVEVPTARSSNVRCYRPSGFRARPRTAAKVPFIPPPSTDNTLYTHDHPPVPSPLCRALNFWQANTPFLPMRPILSTCGQGQEGHVAGRKAETKPYLCRQRPTVRTMCGRIGRVDAFMQSLTGLLQADPRPCPTRAAAGSRCNWAKRWG